MRKAGLGLAAGLAVLVGVALYAGRASIAPPITALRPGDAQVLALGAGVYRDRCASCHGRRLEGQPEWRSRGPDGLLPAPPHDENGHTWHHADELLFRITKYGVGAAINDPGYKSAMPAFDGVLSDAEIVAALSWIKSRWPPEVRRHNDEINAPGRP
jgi:S-disulfanyl-L-cysteine oxidoreductase SoxD